MLQIINQIIAEMVPIGLDEMKSVKLMNRTDTKYVATEGQLAQFLQMAVDEYRVQEIDGQRNMPYSTQYLDTCQCTMYMHHLAGKKTRQKVRVRKYESSGIAFLEVKNKNNKGRTKKKRISFKGYDGAAEQAFIAERTPYAMATLRRQVQNAFHRITLVNKAMTERLTVDTSLCFAHPTTGVKCALQGLVIIELKRDGATYSPAAAMLRSLRIHPGHFSKYCMGMALTVPGLKRNRFKERLRGLTRLCNVAITPPDDQNICWQKGGQCAGVNIHSDVCNSK